MDDSPQPRHAPHCRGLQAYSKGRVVRDVIAARRSWTCAAARPRVGAAPPLGPTPEPDLCRHSALCRSCAATRPRARSPSRRNRVVQRRSCQRSARVACLTTAPPGKKNRRARLVWMKTGQDRGKEEEIRKKKKERERERERKRKRKRKNRK
jgi:hypothetical protein